MKHQVGKFGIARMERIAKADRAVARARELAKCWQYPNGFSHHMTSCEHWLELQAAEWLYKEAGLAVLARSVRRLRDSKDVYAAWLKFDK